MHDCCPKAYLFNGLEEVLFVWSVGWDAAVTTKLERGHEYAHRILLIFSEAVLVVVHYFIKVQ